MLWPYDEYCQTSLAISLFAIKLIVSTIWITRKIENWYSLIWIRLSFDWKQLIEIEM